MEVISASNNLRCESCCIPSGPLLINECYLLRVNSLKLINAILFTLFNHQCGKICQYHCEKSFKKINNLKNISLGNPKYNVCRAILLPTLTLSRNLILLLPNQITQIVATRPLVKSKCHCRIIFNTFNKKYSLYRKFNSIT